jgi:hypothetical protein
LKLEELNLNILRGLLKMSGDVVINHTDGSKFTLRPSDSGCAWPALSGKPLDLRAAINNAGIHDMKAHRLVPGLSHSGIVPYEDRTGTKGIVTVRRTEGYKGEKCGVSLEPVDRIGLLMESHPLKSGARVNESYVSPDGEYALFVWRAAA